MSSLHQEKLLQILPNYSPDSYYPSGSFSSNQYSLETEENLSSKSINEELSIADEHNSEDPIEMISYEAVSFTPTNLNKEIQTNDSFFYLDSQNSSEKMRVMSETIENLTQKCRNYEKQNEMLRKELSSASKEISENNKNGMRGEIQKFKEKLSLHEKMIVKILKIAEDLCEEEPDISNKMLQFDCHTYNYLISKLEIVRYRLTRYATRIQQLEFEKSSISEMLNCYMTTEKIIDTHKSKYSSSENTTPECLNPPISRKSSILMETSANQFVGKHFDDEGYYKRPSSSASELPENQDPFLTRNTLTNLGGISNIAKPNNFQSKHKNGHSFSVSPLIPKPKKTNAKVAVTKENYKSNTLKVQKAEDNKKKSKF